LLLENINDSFFLKSNDTATQIHLRVLDSEEKPLPLDTATKIEVVIGVEAGRVLTLTPKLLSGVGELEFGLDEGDLIPVGKNRLEVHIYTPEGEKHVAPSKGYYMLNIQKPIDELGVEVTTYTLDYFISQVNIKTAGVEDMVNEGNAAILRLNEAETRVDGIIVSANTALDSATLANTKALEAIDNANTATTMANKAVELSEAATARANTSATNADLATNSANLAATKAENAATSANTAIVNMETTTTQLVGEVNTAKQQLIDDAATTKQQLLNDAQQTKEQLTSDVNVAKQEMVAEVNAAKSDAVDATNAANTAAASANTAAEAVAGWGGAVAFVQGKVYSKNNVVTYNGNTYQAKKDGVYSTPPTPPFDNEDWTVLAIRGVDGTGSVASVNGIQPDANGNVTLPVPTGTVKAVNGNPPNRSGNVTLLASDVQAYRTDEVDALIAANKLYFQDHGYGVDNLPYVNEDRLPTIKTSGVYTSGKDGLNNFLPPDTSASYIVSISNSDYGTQNAINYSIIDRRNGKEFKRNIYSDNGVVQTDTGWVEAGSGTELDGANLIDKSVGLSKLSQDVQDTLANAGKTLTSTTANVTLYVNSRTGSDTTGTGTTSAPYATISRAVQEMPDIINHVFKITVYYGDYVENVTIPAKLGSGYINITATDTVNTKMYGIFTFGGFAGSVECTGFSFVLNSSGSTPITYKRCVDAKSTNITVDASAYTGAQQKWAVRCLYGTNLFLNTLTVNAGNDKFTCLEMQGAVRAVVAKASGTTGIGFDAKNGAIIELGDVTTLTTIEPSRTTNYGRVTQL